MRASITTIYSAPPVLSTPYAERLSLWQIVCGNICCRDETGRDDTWTLSAQPTALGIVLNGTRVDVTVPGSPAHACGKIDKADELLMVDGQKVSAQTAMAALRGSDTPASVVSLVLRKSGR